MLGSSLWKIENRRVPGTPALSGWHMSILTPLQRSGRDLLQLCPGGDSAGQPSLRGSWVVGGTWQQAPTDRPCMLRHKQLMPARLFYKHDFFSALIQWIRYSCVHSAGSFISKLLQRTFILKSPVCGGGSCSFS